MNQVSWMLNSKAMSYLVLAHARIIVKGVLVNLLAGFFACLISWGKKKSYFCVEQVEGDVLDGNNKPTEQTFLYRGVTFACSWSRTMRARSFKTSCFRYSACKASTSGLKRTELLVQCRAEFSLDIFKKKKKKKSGCVGEIAPLDMGLFFCN